MIWYPPILTYHRVHPDPATDTPTLSPMVFARQMAQLAQRWHAVDPDALAAWLERRGRLPARAVMVTFDDGTEDTYTQALPVLARHRIPAAVFMIADNVGRPGFLTRDQLRALHGHGVTIGSHTVYHAYLPSRDRDQVRRELVDSKRFLEDQVGAPVDWLSYPGGGYTAEARRLAEEAGYRAACTTNRGTRRWPIDRWALRRITMHASSASPAAIWLRCSGYYNTFRRLRAPS
ncbi:MAG: polysaccharide deacetylase family protein [Candidatus Omnitrophica bacterium]|nr:polysaccharide deacetylase family protein [Candidatus Omnitrophota bacterium]